MKKILPIFLCTISFIMYPQCPNSLVYLNSQSAVDNFSVTYPNCTIITNGLAIANSTDITDLTPLSVITSVSGTTDEDLITIWNNAALENLDGLENINIGNPNDRYIDIMNNPMLTNIQGLSGINGSWQMNIHIADNPALESLQGLENIELNFNTLNSIGIYNNDALVNLNGLEGMVGLDYIDIWGNNALTDLSGLDNLEEVVDLFVRENANIVSVNGLNSLALMYGVSLLDNPNLNDISQFSNTMLNGSLNISNNPNLSVCNNNMVCTHIENGGFSTVVNNEVGCNSIAEVEAECLLSVSEVDLNSSIALFPNPVSEILQINAAEGIVVEKVRVYSLLGEELLVSSEKSNNISTLSEGIYFIEIITDQGIASKKIVKQ